MANFRHEFMLYDEWWVHYERFDHYAGLDPSLGAGTPIDEVNEWRATLVGAGTRTLSNNLFPPHLIITNAGADNDSTELQRTLAGAPGDFVNLGSGRKHYFETMIRFRDADNDQDTVEQLDWFVGWAIDDTTVLAGATDFIGFSKVDQDTDATNRIVFVHGDAGLAAGLLRDQTITTINWTSNNPTGVLATDRAAKVLGPNQWIRLAFAVGMGTATVGTAWVRVNDLTEAVVNLGTTIPDTTLCTTLCVQNGQAQAKFMDVAYIFEAIAYGGV